VGPISWIAGATTATKDGFAFDFRAQASGPKPASFTPSLYKELPAGSVVAIDFPSVKEALDKLLASPSVSEQLKPLEAAGVSKSDLTGLFAKEVAVSIGGGSTAKTPELTIVSAVDDTQKALEVVNKLLGLAGLATGSQVQTTQVAGVDVKQLKVQGTTVGFAAFDGKLVITTSTTAIEAMRNGKKLTDDAAFNSAKDLAGLPDDVAALVFVNVQDGLPVFGSLASAAGNLNLGGGTPTNPLGQIPPSSVKALKPLRSVLLYAQQSGDTTTVHGFVEIK
jgi:hypothetical protein